MTALSVTAEIELWNADFGFEFADQSSKLRGRNRGGALQKCRPFASATSTLSEKFLSKNSSAPCPPPPKVWNPTQTAASNFKTCPRLLTFQNGRLYVPC